MHHEHHGKLKGKRGFDNFRISSSMIHVGCGGEDLWAAFLDGLARKGWTVCAETDSNRGTINLIVDKRSCPPYSFLELLIC